MVELPAILRCARRKPGRKWPTFPPFWYLCFVAITSLGVSFVLFATSVAPTFRFVFALLCWTTASTVQKFTVLETNVILSHRKRLCSAAILEAVLSNWAEASLAVVAVLKGQTAAAQAFIVGTIVVNHLFLLGACFVHEGHHGRETGYPMLMALLHARTLALCLACVILPAALTLSSDVKGDQVTNICRFTALVLLLVSVCHAAFFCYVHSTLVLEAQSLHGMVHARGNRAEIDSFAHGTSRRLTMSIAEQLHVQRAIWLSAKVTSDTKSLSIAKSPNLRDSAVNTAILLVSSGTSLCSCFYLVESISPSDPIQWISSLRVVYVIVPLFTGLAGIGATFLHSRRYNAALDSGEIILGAIASTSRLLHAIFPASVIAGWAIGSTHSMMHFDTFQIVILGVAVLLPTYLFQTGSDDWLTGSMLLALYLLYAGSAWVSTEHI